LLSDHFSAKSDRFFGSSGIRYLSATAADGSAVAYFSLNIGGGTVLIDGNSGGGRKYMCCRQDY
jgi:hypothetical protein